MLSVKINLSNNLITVQQISAEPGILSLHNNYQLLASMGKPQYSSYAIQTIHPNPSKYILFLAPNNFLKLSNNCSRKLRFLNYPCFPLNYHALRYQLLTRSASFWVPPWFFEFLFKLSLPTSEFWKGFRTKIKWKLCMTK